MRKANLKTLVPLGLLLGTTLLGIGCGGSSSTPTQASTPTGDYDTSLKFDATAYTSITVSVDGTDMAVRKYGPIKYVANPVQMALTQSSMMGSTTLTDGYEMEEMYVYVPETSASDQKTAIWMQFNNGGWFFSVVKDPITDGASFTSNDTTPIAYALKAGYIIASVGTRGRMAVAADGTYAGKAPACIVDAKAAIRYMRLNDTLMSGSAERIIIDGTSGGGGLVTTVGASADSSDYNADLASIGAAGIKASGSTFISTLSDKPFVVQAYCPINNLAHADEGYEYQFNAIRGLTNDITLNGVATTLPLTPALNSVDYANDSNSQAASVAIASNFPAYVASLGLKLEDGSAFTAEKIPSLVMAQVESDINDRLAEGTLTVSSGTSTSKATVPAYGDTFTNVSVDFRPPYATTTKVLSNDWLTLTGTGTSARVATIDYTNYLKFVTSLTQLKTVVAFDAVGANGVTSTNSGESNLYGSTSASTVYSNFSEWSWNNNTLVGDGSGLFDTGLTWNQYLATSVGLSLAKQLKMSSPIPYLISSNASPAPYWYVRHGMIDRDTSFAIQMVLKYAIENNANVKGLDFKFPYLTPHSGDYDASEAFAWFAEQLAANPL
nr:subtype B tannase [uncultured Holophaga sp.]